jgi:hypothetical protein
MDKINLTRTELTELFSEIQKFSLDEINEHNSDDNYSIEEKRWNEQYMRGLSHGAELLAKNILSTIKYKNLVESK